MEKIFRWLVDSRFRGNDGKHPEHRRRHSRTSIPRHSRESGNPRRSAPWRDRNVVRWVPASRPGSGDRGHRRMRLPASRARFRSRPVSMPFMSPAPPPSAPRSPKCSIAGESRSNRPTTPARPVLRLSDERFSRRLLSIDPNTGKEREFELAYQDLLPAHRCRRGSARAETDGVPASRLRIRYGCGARNEPRTGRAPRRDAPRRGRPDRAPDRSFRSGVKRTRPGPCDGRGHGVTFSAASVGCMNLLTGNLGHQGDKRDSMSKNGKHGDYTVDPENGYKYLKIVFVHGITLGGRLIKGTVVSASLAPVSCFIRFFPGDGLQYGTDGKGNAYHIPSRRK